MGIFKSSDKTCVSTLNIYNALSETPIHFTIMIIVYNSDKG